MKCDILISVLSWEERYVLSLEKNLSNYKPTMVILFIYNNPLTSAWKVENHTKTKNLLGDKLIEKEINGNQPEINWFIFKETFSEFCQGLNVVIDITTMTRESIWLSLYNCKLNKCNTTYIYYKPAGYSSDWISRDPGKPRLLYKMSGIAQLGVPSLLLVTGGYDIQRLDSLIYNFEPKKTMLFFHDGEESRNKKNFKDCEKLFKHKYNVDQIYKYNAYNVEDSKKALLEKLFEKDSLTGERYLDTYNIILNSLGAKTSAITLFNIWLEHPQISLSYIPSKEYNREYSFGIGDSCTGKIHF